MAMLRYGLVFSLVLIVTAADDCRDRHEAIDFPLKYVTVPDDMPIDWNDASEQCKLQHPGYGILERRYLWLSEEQKTPCKGLLVPLGIMKFGDTDKLNGVFWLRLPPGINKIRPTDMSHYREVKDLTSNVYSQYYGALNLTDGTWHWKLDDLPIFTCVICQHAYNYSLIFDDFDRYACFWRDSWINKTLHQITLQHVSEGEILDDYRIEEAVACAFNLTVDFVAILKDHENNRNEVMVHLVLNGTVDTQQYLGRVLDGYNLTNILVYDKLKMCPTVIGRNGSHHGYRWPHVISTPEMTMWRDGLVFSLALIVTAANECRERVEAFDFPLKYVTVPHDTPLDLRSASDQCQLLHPGYDIIERRYWSLNEHRKSQCNDLLVPLGLLKKDVNDWNDVVWLRTPPGLDGIRPRDISNYRQETNVTGNEYLGALNLTDGTWHWVDDDSPIFTCVICQHADNNSLIIDDFKRYSCYWRDSWINKTFYQVTMQHVAAHVTLDEYEMEEMVACAFNLTHDFVVIFENDEEGNKNEVIAHMALNGTFDTQQYIGRAMEGYNVTDIIVIDTFKICPESLPSLFQFPKVVIGAD